MSSQQAQSISLVPLAPFKPPLHSRAWSSTPHPTLPLLATTHEKQVTVYSLSTLTKHSALTGGHTRSVRCAAWKPGLPPGKLCLVTGSFDATAGLWRWEGSRSQQPSQAYDADGLEVDVTAKTRQRIRSDDDEAVEADRKEDDDDDDEWEFTLVLEGHENEIKSCAFSPSGQFLATSSRDKTVWIWEDVGPSEADDEWETVAVLGEHDGDVKAVAWCPDTPGRNRRARHGVDVLASASYDDTVRVWREDGDGEWVCVAVLEGHGGTVWGVQWEERSSERMPRLLSWSADGTVRVWGLVEEQEEDAAEGGEGGKGGGTAGRNGNPWMAGGIPNTMRRGLREDWRCEAVLPKVHGRDVYSASWSGTSGRVASTGSDGVVAVYAEVEDGQDGDAVMTAPETKESGQPTEGRWRVLGTVVHAHGPYEVNHVTWCKRFDGGTDRKGVEEMLVTTGDDGTVRPWKLT